MHIYQSFTLAHTAAPLHTTNFIQEDLAIWIRAAEGSTEHSARVKLAKVIVQCYNDRSTELFIEGGEISSLPRAIGSLVHLQELRITKSWQLESLPPEIGWLRNLQKLVLSDLGISGLPPELGALPLRYLVVENTRILSLPKEIGLCSHLNTLLLLNNLISSLPDTIGNLGQLQRLSLINNPHLISLPKTIGQLKNLQVLDLKGGAFSYLPKGLFSLASLRHLNIEGCPFSENVLDRLQPFASQCTILTSPNTERMTQRRIRDLYDLLKELYHISGSKRIPELKSVWSHPQVECLRIFLNKCSYFADFQKESLKNEALAKKIVSCIEFADLDTSYRERFFKCLNEAADTNGEEILLELLFLEFERTLSALEPKDLRSIYETLRGILWVRKIISIAQKSFEEFSIFDKAGVSLGYLVGLGNWHSLPLNGENWISPHSNQIPNIQLHSASREIEFAEANFKYQAEFLVEQDLWLKALECLDPQVFEGSKGDRYALTDWTENLIRKMSSPTKP